MRTTEAQSNELLVKKQEQVSQLLGPILVSAVTISAMLLISMAQSIYLARQDKAADDMYLQVPSLKDQLCCTRKQKRLTRRTEFL